MTPQGHTSLPGLQVSWGEGAPEEKGWLCPPSFSSPNHLPGKSGELVGELRANGAGSMWKKTARAGMPPNPILTIVCCTYPV